MLIALVSPPQGGKNLLANHLIIHHDFKRVLISQIPPNATDSKTLHFASSSDFLTYATLNWRCHFVTTDLREKTQLQEFLKRPFVVVVSIQAPIRLRWQRAVQCAQKSATRSPPTLEEFVDEDDIAFHGLAPLIDTSTATQSTTLLDPNSTPQKSRSLSPTSFVPLSPIPSPPPRFASIVSPPDAPSSIHIVDPLVALLPLASLSLSNGYSTTEEFLALLTPELFLIPLEASLRPPWDEYFMLLASLASLRSNCMKRRVGAVLVREKRVVSTGYNGTPRGVKNCSEGGCGRCNGWGDGLNLNLEAELGELVIGGEERGQAVMGEGLDECLCLHAEENALLEAGRERVSGGGTTGAVLYCNTCPCLRCTVKIVQCGVTEVVYSLSYSMDAASRRVLEEAGVGLRQIPQPLFRLGA